MKLGWGDEIAFEDSASFELESENLLPDSRKEEFEKVSERGNPEKNLLFKTFLFCRELKPEIQGVRIHLKKRIPPGGGLGGGSSNAAILIRNFFRSEEFTEDFLKKVSGLGADIPFFLLDSHAYVTGIGEVLEPLEISSGYGILVFPDLNVSTGEAFQALKKPLQETGSLESCKSVPEDLLNLVRSGDWSGMDARIQNDFEPFVLGKFPDLALLKNEMLQSGLEFVSMTGTGSTFYGLVKEFGVLPGVISRLKSKFSKYQVIDFHF